MTTYDSITQQINTIVKTPEPAGTMFSKIGPLDQQRDLTVKKVKNDYDNQTTVMTVNKQVTDVVGFFKQKFGMSRASANINKGQIEKLKTDITDSQSTIDSLGLSQPDIQQFLILLACVAVVYYFGSFLGWIIHVVAFIILVTGSYYIISGTPNNGQSGIVTSTFGAISAF